MTGGYNKPLPAIVNSSRRFWEAAKAKRLELPRCNQCDLIHVYFDAMCSRCGHEGVHWEVLTGRGRIWANCRFHRSYFSGFENDLPYNVAIVELEEGPRLVTNIVGLPTGALNEMPIGMAVDAVFEDVTDEITLIKFKPSSYSNRIPRD